MRKGNMVLAMLFLLMGTFLFAQQKINDKDLAALNRPDSISVKTRIPLRINPIKTHIDSIEAVGTLKFKPYKKRVHASYYADKFNGRRTASGQKFNNNRYTAAHRNLPFGTKLRLTNEVNGKCVIVEITDRGPFTKSREIDITKKAFMDIAHDKRSGGLNVTIEEVVGKE